MLERWREGPRSGAIPGGVLLCDPPEDGAGLGSDWRILEMTGEHQEREDGTDAAGDSIAARVQRAWRASVGTYATDEGETKNLLQRLVEFGTLSQKEAKDALHDMKSRIEENRRELDKRVDESLKRATARLTLPSPSDIEKLRARVADLEKRVAEAEGRRG